ncbi:MAG: hypothetical protein IT330_03275 [Anaerolineae bacterium]|nr:hypothetical protein [Anaerolineae bacterium]
MPRGRFILFVLIGVILLAAIGALALAASSLVTPSAITPPLLWSDPLAAIDPADIAPDIALRSLAGEPEDVTAEQSLRVEGAEQSLSIREQMQATAYANIVHSPDMDDTRRAGLLLLLADRYMLAKNRERAALCAYQVYDITALSLTLNDFTRAEASLHVAIIWQATGHEELARLALEQAANVTSGSLVLQSAQRRSLWEQIARRYRALGDTELAEQMQTRAEKAEPPRAGPRPVGLVVATLPAPEPNSSEVNQAIFERQKRALVIVESLSRGLQSGVAPDIGPETADLAEYLRREDVVRKALYDRVIAGPELGPRVGAARARIQWLTLKLRVAQKGYGLSIVPEWEEVAAAIRAELVLAYADYLALRLDQITALPNAEDLNRGRLEILREMVLHGRLGLYPDFPMELRAAELDEAVEELRLHGRLGGLALRSRGEAGERIFILEENR